LTSDTNAASEAEAEAEAEAMGIKVFRVEVDD
jgi:hypothetical protein